MLIKVKAIEVLKQQLSIIPILREKHRENTDFPKWHRDTEVAIEQIFGPNTRHLKDFKDVHYYLGICTTSTPDSAFQEAYVDGLDRASAVLQSMIQEIEQYWEDRPTSQVPNTSDAVERLCNRFHFVVRQLRMRHANRPTLSVDDEYDVQDLTHALLTLYFDDIRPEEWTPSYAGACARMDFLLKKEQVVIETKKTRKGLEAKQVGEQLIVDIERYRGHPDCKTLLCFVYDPEGRIGNPRGLENDLSRDEDGFEVKVLIRPSGA